MNLKSATAIVAASAAMMFAQSATIPPPPQAAKAGFTKLVLNEDFSHFDLNHPSPNGVAWQKFPSNGKTVSDDHFSVSNGVLTMTTPPDPNRAARATISTWQAAPWQKDFLHGYFEARIRFDLNPDNANGFWLSSGIPEVRARARTGYADTRWCEIDIMEPRGTSIYTASMLDWQEGKKVQLLQTKVPFPPGTGFSNWNTYGVLWEPGKVSWYLNDKLVASSPSPAICDQDRLNVEIDAKKQQGPEDQKIQVNWVRVYQ
jgi:beta-glucanase (GH16 family)